MADHLHVLSRHQIAALKLLSPADAVCRADWTYYRVGGDVIRARTLWPLVNRGLIAHSKNEHGHDEFVITDAGRAALEHGEPANG